MSDLRRRVGKALDDLTSKPPTHEDVPKPDEDVKIVSQTKYDKISTKKSGKKKTSFIFILGSIVGLVAALAFAQHHEVIRLDGLLDVDLDSLINVIPAGIIKEAKELQKSERHAVSYDSFAVGLHLQSQGVKSHHPVIMIPGVISTGLESWGTEEASRQYFRKRLWGSWSMMKALVMDQASWKRHIMLDKVTGLDPPGIKLRAAQGFDATDFFITGYWIWNKILENLATIGYDPTNAFTAAYDWRLSYMNLEVRDGYFTKLKNYIEGAERHTGRKVVLVSHSMGGQVLFYFFKWVEHKNHGNGGPDWVDKHVEAWINISGCMLGAAKGVPAVLSGEMKDTAQLNALAVYGLERFLSKEERVELFRAMPGISSMLPKGGETIWGDMNWAPDDLPGPDASATNNTIPPPIKDARSFGPFISFKPPINSSENVPQNNLTVSGSLEYLFNNSDDWYRDQVQDSYSHGVAHTKAEVEKNENHPRTWLNPLEARLPLAPNLKIYCFYGIGKPTERAYFYKEREHPPLPSVLNHSNETVNVTIDTSFSYGDGWVQNGVIFGEGDGTVNLISNGFMCARGWRNISRYNPAGVKVTTYEMPHEPDRFSPRGGPNTGDHVDILGRSSLNDLVLRVAGGKGDDIEDHYESRIWEISNKVKISNDD